ncbi:MAG: hypothetical protein ACREPR_03485 [Brasilonema sp.]
MSENSKKKLLQQILIIVSGVAFLGFMVFPLAGLFNQSSQESQNAVRPDVAQGDVQQLQNQEQGYAEAYKREPNNPFVLQNLIKTRFQLYQITGKVEPLEGTIEPLEKLLKLTPPQEQKIVIQNLLQARLALYQKTNKIEMLKGTVQPLDKLIQLSPPEDQAKLKQIREVIKQEISHPKQRTQETPKSSNP